MNRSTAVELEGQTAPAPLFTETRTRSDSFVSRGPTTLAAALLAAGAAVWVLAPRPAQAPLPSDPPAPEVPAPMAVDPLVAWQPGGRAASPAEDGFVPLLLRQSVPMEALKPAVEAEPLSSVAQDPAPELELKLAQSLSGLFRYEKGLPNQLRSIVLSQTREVWTLARIPPPPPAQLERQPAPNGSQSFTYEVPVAPFAPAEPAEPAAPAGRRERVFYSRTRRVAPTPVSAPRPAAAAPPQQAPEGRAAGKAPAEPAQVFQRLSANSTFLDIQKAEAEAAATSTGIKRGKEVVGWQAVCLNISCQGQGPSLEVRFADGTTENMKFDPLVLDLAGTGLNPAKSTADFDLDGDGRLETVNELPPGSGLLVFDANKDGASGKGPLELLGAASDVDGDGKPDGYRDGFDALVALVRRAVRERAVSAGALKAGRLGALELAALERVYGLRVRVGAFGAAARPLAEAGVRDLALGTPRASRRTNSFDGQGNDITRRAGATFLRADGTQGEYADVWLTSRKLRLLASRR